MYFKIIVSVIKRQQKLFIHPKQKFDDVILFVCLCLHRINVILLQF